MFPLNESLNCELYVLQVFHGSVTKIYVVWGGGFPVVVVDLFLLFILQDVFLHVR